MSGTIVSIILIGISAFLTGLNIFNKIGKFAGAGSLVPITGFANSIVSPAMEYKSEGYVMGVGGKMFTVAGPVLVFGISASIIVGLVYLLFNTQSITLDKIIYFLDFVLYFLFYILFVFFVYILIFMLGVEFFEKNR